MITASLLLAALSQKTPVLTYHDIILKRDAKSVWFDCTVDEFREQIAYFKKRKATFISMEQLRQSLETGKTLPKNALCITFADNYAGFYKYAWPILRSERIPVAQFVHTDFVGMAKGRPKMSWKQLIELDRSGLVTVASQTCSHPADLTKLTEPQLTHEFVESKRVLEAKLGHRVDAVAYPNGKFNARVSKAAKGANYKIGFTEVTEPAQKMTDLWRVPRYVHTKYRAALAECFGKS